MKVTAHHAGSVRLLDRRLRLVELLGPELPGSRRPTDRELLFEPLATTAAEYLAFGRPRPIAHCFEADGRRAKFVVDEGEHGDRLLDLLASRPKTPVRLAKPYGTKGWVVEE